MAIPRKTKTIPVRMDVATASALDFGATQLGTTRSAIIRLGILKLLPEIRAGRITFNPVLEGALIRSSLKAEG